MLIYSTKDVQYDMFEQIKKYIDKSKKDMFVISVEPVKNKRSHAQNRLYWKVLRLITDASKGWGDGSFDDWTTEDFHEAISEKYLRELNKKTNRMHTRSTTSLTVEEFSKHIDLVINKILVETFNGTFEDVELYKEAMNELP